MNAVTSEKSRGAFRGGALVAFLLSAVLGFVGTPDNAAADCFEKNEDQCKCSATNDGDFASCTAQEHGGHDECEAYWPIKVGCKHVFDSCDFTTTASSSCPVNYTPSGECWDLKRLQCRPCDNPPSGGCGGDGSDF